MKFFIINSFRFIVYIAYFAIIAVHDPNGVRMPERVKAGKFAINGVSLAPIEKTVENGRKIIAFRTEKTVAAIRKAMEAAKITP